MTYTVKTIIQSGRDGEAGEAYHAVAIVMVA